MDLPTPTPFATPDPDLTTIEWPEGMFEDLAQNVVQGWNLANQTGAIEGFQMLILVLIVIVGVAVIIWMLRRS